MGLSWRYFFVRLVWTVVRSRATVNLTFNQNIYYKMIFTFLAQLIFFLILTYRFTIYKYLHYSKARHEMKNKKKNKAKKHCILVLFLFGVMISLFYMCILMRLISPFTIYFTFAAYRKSILDTLLLFKELPNQF